MKDFADEIIEYVLAKEMVKVDNIMRYMANKIQGDFVALTYRLLDAYYQNYKPEYYIRTDQLKGGFNKSGRKRGKDGKFVKASKAEQARRSDISLYEAMRGMDGGQPAIGISRENGAGGYIAGVCFDEHYFSARMKHSVHGLGFDEMDIVSNFLFSDSSEFGYGIHPKAERSPAAATEIDNFLYNYNSRMYKHYNDALKKFGRKE